MIALVQYGDQIRIDIPSRGIELLAPQAELSTRPEALGGVWAVRDVSYDGRTGEATCGNVLAPGLTSKEPHVATESKGRAVRVEAALAEAGEATSGRDRGRGTRDGKSITETLTAPAMGRSWGERYATSMADLGRQYEAAESGLRARMADLGYDWPL